jgi:hypothetical protein
MKKRLFPIVSVIIALLVTLFVIFRTSNPRPANKVEDGAASELLDLKESHRTDEIGNQSAEFNPQNPSPIAQTSDSTKEFEQSDGDDQSDKFRRMTIEEEISKVAKLYPSILNRKGFTEHESEVIVRLQIEEIRSPNNGEDSSIDKASRELGFGAEKKNLLNEAFDELFVGGLVEYTNADVASCMSRRLNGISDCTKAVLDEYLKDMALSLESDVFVMNQRIGELTRSAVKKAIETCRETPERANYQFRLVFVECDPI